MNELGEFLKKARRDNGLSLREISELTKIQVHYLEALEEGDFGKFPGEVYLKGALRNYAEAVGLDPETVLEQYRSLAGEPPAEEPVEPVKKTPSRPHTLPGERSPSFIYGLIVILLLLAAGSYWFVKNYQKDGLPLEPGPSGNQEEPAAPETPGSSGEETPGQEETAPNETEVEIRVSAQESTERETVFYVNNAEQLELELLCSERCWIDMQVDGKEQFPQRNLQKGEEITAGASEKIWIRLGNPRGVKLTLNGIDVAEVSRQKNPHNYLFVLKN
ncbi:MAG: helix-turn-helix domain-containing protein [Dethiobacteria bacterium]